MASPVQTPVAKKHKRHKSERRERLESPSDKPAGLKLILKVNEPVIRILLIAIVYVCVCVCRSEVSLRDGAATLEIYRFYEAHCCSVN